LSGGRFIQILQSRETYDNLVPELMRGGTVQLDPQDGFSDPLISQIALTIANELEDGCRTAFPVTRSIAHSHYKSCGVWLTRRQSCLRRPTGYPAIA
jgi:hypothetical protein